jgi:hypothetical protein
MPNNTTLQRECQVSYTWSNSIPNNITYTNSIYSTTKLQQEEKVCKDEKEKSKFKKTWEAT